MRILYDSQIFTLQKFGGISRYFVELVNHLPDGYYPKISLKVSDNAYVKEDKGAFKRVFECPSKKYKEQIERGVNHWSDIMSLRANRIDLFHPTYYNPYFLRHLKAPYVITVHDMIHERYAHLFPNDTTYREKEETIKKAQRIIAISHYTKKDIMDIYDIPEDRIDVVYHGYSVDGIPTPVIGLPEKYVLFVGQRFHYKNFKRFVEAFAMLNKRYPDIYLVCTGKKFDNEELNEFKQVGIADKIKQYYVNDSQLTYLYQNALCFVFPSLYEGFGIPILEAFACNCPVVLSDASCFPEIAKDAAAYFNPLDVESMVDAMTSVIENEELKNELKQRGAERLRTFSWDKMAIATATIYSKI